MDWNGDGKHDWKDDAIFHNVINSDEKEHSNKSRSTGGSNSSAGRSGLISTIVSLAYLSVLIPGDIPINGFTMFIGLICAGVLVVKFLGWLYK
jgi:hypothetical protein